MNPYYDDGKGIVIYHGDCREILPGLPKVDLVLTDPPYGINHSSAHGATWKNTTIAGDFDSYLRDYVLESLCNIPAFVFGSWKVARPEFTRAVLIWDKGPASGMGDLSFPWKLSWEEIYVIGDGFVGNRDEGVIKGHRVFTWQGGADMTGREGRKHPNEKPISLCAYLLQKHLGEVTLDPFMGSGTTLRAAKDLGRKAIGIEIEERYCEIAARRLAQEVLSLA